MQKIEQLTKDLEAEVKEIEKTVGQVRDRNSLQEILKTYYRIREAYEALDAVRLKFYHIKDQLDKVTVPEAIAESGFDKVQVPELERSFYPLIKYSASIVDKAKGYDWLRANGGEALITETVNAQTLAGFFRDMLQEKNIDPPEDLFKFSTYKTTGMSKYTPKGQ